MNQITLTLPGENNFFIEEAYKVLRTNLQFCGQDVKVICVTSCNENEGKSVVSLNVGKNFAALGKRVLVIDADMRKSVIAGRNLDVEDPKGLSEVLTGLCTLDECLYRVEDTEMHVLFSGQRPPNPVELVSGKYFDQLVQECRGRYDHIIIDTPPLGQVIDAAVIARACDGAVLVLGTPTSYRRVQSVIDQLRKSGCNFLGIVRNLLRRSGRGGKMYAYGASRKYQKRRQKAAAK